MFRQYSCRDAAHSSVLMLVKTLVNGNSHEECRQHARRMIGISLRCLVAHALVVLLTHNEWVKMKFSYTAVALLQFTLRPDVWWWKWYICFFLFPPTGEERKRKKKEGENAKYKERERYSTSVEGETFNECTVAVENMRFSLCLIRIFSPVWSNLLSRELVRARKEENAARRMEKYLQPLPMIRYSLLHLKC